MRAKSGQKRILSGLTTEEIPGQKRKDTVPLEGLEPPTISLGRNCSSIELQRLTARFYRVATRADSSEGSPAQLYPSTTIAEVEGVSSSTNPISSSRDSSRGCVITVTCLRCGCPPPYRHVSLISLFHPSNNSSGSRHDVDNAPQPGSARRVQVERRARRDRAPMVRVVGVLVVLLDVHRSVVVDRLHVGHVVVGEPRNGPDDVFFYSLVEHIAPSKYKFGEESEVKETHKKGEAKFDKTKRDLSALKRAWRKFC